MPSLSGKNSPYSASFTGGGLMLSETNIIIPLFLEKDASEVIKELRKDTSILQIRSAQSRDRVANEINKRFKAMPKDFWEIYLTMDENQQKAALLFVILKTYLLLFEFQVNLVIPKYHSPDRVLTKNDVLTALSEVAARDEFVDSWSDQTRGRASSQFVSILRQAGLINPVSGELQPLVLGDEDFVYYIRIGELWFLQACLLPGYKIERIKEIAL